MAPPKPIRSDRTDRKWRRRRVALGLLGLAIAAALVVWYVIVPYPRGLDDRNPERTSVMEQRLREGRRTGDSLEIRQEWMPLEEISPRLVRAVVVAEDYRFRQHEGIDWVSLAEEVRWSGDDDFSWWSRSDLRALLEALEYVWSNRDEIRGRSTITQQLAKNLYFGTDRSLLRKAMELVVAKRLERKLSKDRILELYLNIAEWGPGIFGAEAAARAYFGRSASALTLVQAASLAATLPHPLTSNPAHNPGRMAWRRELILDRIDPARGLPTTPMPLPEPRLGLDPGLPEVDVGGVVPLTPGDSAGAPGRPAVDTIRVDSTAVDTTAVDTTVADTTGADTTAADTTGRTSLWRPIRPADYPFRRSPARPPPEPSFPACR